MRSLVRGAQPLLRGASTAGGAALATATSLLAGRPAAKPLHPRGSVVRGTLSRWGDDATASGVAWLDDAGEDDVLVRLSRAVGLPSPVPDILGLAVRVPCGEDAHADLLFASTGSGPVTRFVLAPVTARRRRTLTTLLPYRTSTGPLVLSAVFEDDDHLTLSWARGPGPWRGFGRLSLHEDAAQPGDATVSFDPVRNHLPGLDTYGWVRRLREPSYATARRSRRPARGS